MASLNHVCMWSEHGWTRVTAEEAGKLHPGGTVSAHSGLFMCELCGQYVTLTDGGEKVRHFRHSAHEASKSCPERTFGPLYTPSYKNDAHELPIKLIQTSNSFQFELGLLFIPREILQKERNRSITIKASDSIRYTYSFERLNPDSITYLPIGNVPQEKYEVISSDRLVTFWPRIVKGVSKNGSLFDITTGKMLPEDSDVLLQRQYHLVTTKKIDCLCSSVDIALQQEVRSGWSVWRLYIVEAKKLDQDAAKFFLSLHCRLTDAPVQISPIWPLHIEYPYVIKHPADALLLHMKGARDTRISTFPMSTTRTQRCSKNGRIAKVGCNGRQQLISYGQSTVLEYLYFWKDPLNSVFSAPEFQVKDLRGELIDEGEHYELPLREIAIIWTAFDGIIQIYRKQQLIDKRMIKAQESYTIDSLTFDMQLKLFVGLDLVWTASFNTVRDTKTSDETIASKLYSFRGSEVHVPHEYGSLFGQLENYPLVRRWLRQAIRNGKAPNKALKYLKRIAFETSENR